MYNRNNFETAYVNNAKKEYSISAAIKLLRDQTR